MKLASERTSGRDGGLLVVARDLQRCVSAADIAPTLQAALDDWKRVAPQLEALYEELNQGQVASHRSFANLELALSAIPRIQLEPDPQQPGAEPGPKPPL